MSNKKDAGKGSPQSEEKGPWFRFPELGEATCNETVESVLAFDEQLGGLRKVSSPRLHFYLPFPIHYCIFQSLAKERAQDAPYCLRTLKVSTSCLLSLLTSRLLAG
jgi:hypothetical protein